MLASAILLASEIHKDQFDKGGKPYILHPLWVMDKVRHLGYKAMIIAVLHDVIEDSPLSMNLTLKSMRYAGISDEIIEILEILNVKNHDDYDTYIKKIAEHPLAREVKMRDLEHNSKITRLKGIREKDLQRIEKYHKAYLYLKSYQQK
jgi:hypothetical protein